MERMSVMIVTSILLLSILPIVTANPMPMSVWEDAQAGGSPEPRPRNTNVTFFKEIVKADIGKNTVHLHADYWFRNERDRNESIDVLLPLSKNPRDIDLKANDLQTGWSRSSYMYDDGHQHIEYQAIAFEIFFSPFEEVKVTVDFWDDVSKYDSSLNNHIVYFYSYLVGSAKTWYRNLESASFEFRVPVSMYDRGEYDGWERDRDGSDYVFTKEYTDWLPLNVSEHESLTWETDRPILSWKIKIENGPDITVGTVLLILAIAVIMAILIIVLIKYRSRGRGDR